MNVQEIARTDGQQEEQADSRELGELRQTLAQREARLAELEESVAYLSGVLQQKEEALQRQQTQAARLSEDLASALGQYRMALLASAPEVPEELVQGASLQDIEVAMDRARKLVARIKSQVEATLLAQRVPAGAPLRLAPDVSGLSSKDKIALGLARTGK